MAGRSWPGMVVRSSTDIEDNEDGFDDDRTADTECLLAKDGTRIVQRSRDVRADRPTGIFGAVRVCYNRVAAIMSRRRRHGGKISIDENDGYSEPEKYVVSKKGSSCSRKCSQVLLKGMVILLAACGLIFIISVSSGFIVSYEKPDLFLSQLAKDLERGDRSSPMLVDITKDVKPVPCHSHNDYWRSIPLFEALHYGITSVEADVWLFENDLFVGHDTGSLDNKTTFRKIYIDPLQEILDRKNPPSAATDSQFRGVFDEDLNQPLILLVDIKNNGSESFKLVEKQLDGLRSKGYLSHFNGTAVVSRPITVVSTGDTPFDLLVSNQTYRDIFFDAPLDRIWQDRQIALHRTTSLDSGSERQGQGHAGIGKVTDAAFFTPENSYYASMPLKSILGWPVLSKLSEEKLSRIREQIEAAHEQGLKVRYWDTPDWPVGLRNYVWDLLVREGVDMLNVDDLKAAAKGDWRNAMNGFLWW